MFWNGITANDGLSGKNGALPVRTGRTGQRLRREPCHRRSKTVAAPANGLNAASLGSCVVQNPAKYRDLHVEIAVFDRGSRPDRSDDLGPRDEFSWPLDQHAENVERARTHYQWSKNTALIPAKQDADPPVETKLPEKADIRRGRCVHAVAPYVSPNFRMF
jgi:hypothetical protein